MHDYVIEQLSTYQEACQNIQTLEFELRALNLRRRESPNELIESMTFSHSGEEPVQSGQRSDKTASIALNYRTVNAEQTRELREELSRQLACYRLRVLRLEAYLDILPPDEADVLRRFYFDQMTWNEIAQTGHRCIRTIMRYRDKAMARLEAFYRRLAELGMLPEVDTQESNHLW